MGDTAQRVAVLGVTGSIGRSACDVLRSGGSRLSLAAASAHSRLNELCAVADEFRPPFVIATDEQAAQSFDWAALPRGVRVEFGADAACTAAASDDVDVVVSAVVGVAGLPGTLAAVQAGKRVALANKETMVAAGPIVNRAAAASGAEIIPVDSEHSAIFQCLASGESKEVRRIVLTASGGPFRTWSADRQATATPEQALRHPTWNMGPKISVDSATMMNKALEIIEARWLFGLPADKIDVVVHPQSIVHSLVEFVDGSIVAQLSPPDMRLPIQYALTYPERSDGPANKLDWTKAWELAFEPPDEERFPALALGKEVAAAGGTSGAVVNAANEAAVAAFLAGEIRFAEIVPICRRVLEAHDFDSDPNLNTVMKWDRWARLEATRSTCTR